MPRRETPPPPAAPIDDPGETAYGIGYAEGYQIGWEDGYSEGYNDGAEDVWNADHDDPPPPAWRTRTLADVGNAQEKAALLSRAEALGLDP